MSIQDEVPSSWESLAPELVRKIASKLHPNDSAASLKFVNSQTAEALREYQTVTLGHKRKSRVDPAPHRAVEPWPGHAFVAHWGRPEPWRCLSLHQRERLLCLAASSGHVPSLDAALAQCGCALKPEVLTAAAAVGNLAICERLLHGEGCSISADCAAAAAEGGHLPVLRLLLEAGGAKMRPLSLYSASKAASCGGHRAVLDWLQQAHAEPISRTWNALAAARAGQVEVLEHLLAVVPEYKAEEDAAVEGGGEDKGQRQPRWELLVDIAKGCPAAVLQRHYDRLWRWRGMLLGAGGAGVGAGNAPGLELREFVGEDEGRDELMARLLTAAISSPTPCWPQKVDFLLRDCWGPAVTWQVLRGDNCHHLWCIWEEAAEQPDFLARLRRLHAAGLALDDGAVEAAACGGHTDALAWLWDEAGVPGEHFIWRYSSSQLWVKQHVASDVELLSFLRERGAVFMAEHVKAATQYHWPDGPLLWLVEAAAAVESPGDSGGSSVEQEQRAWSAAFSAVAHQGGGLQLLRALREKRGAAVDLGAVVAGGSVEALEWAWEEAQHEAEHGAGTAQAPNIDDLARCAFQSGNIATLRWLLACGLLVTPPPYYAWLPPFAVACSEVYPGTFHRLRLWVELHTATLRAADGSPGATPAADVAHDASVVVGRVWSAVMGAVRAMADEVAAGGAGGGGGPPSLEQLLLPHQVQWIERQWVRAP